MRNPKALLEVCLDSGEIVTAAVVVVVARVGLEIGMTRMGRDVSGDDGATMSGGSGTITADPSSSHPPPNSVALRLVPFSSLGEDTEGDFQPEPPPAAVTG